MYKIRMVLQKEIGLGGIKTTSRTPFRRIRIFDIKEYYKYINLYNTRLNIFSTINPYDDITDYSTIRLNVISLDIDKHFDTSERIHNWLDDKDLRHVTNFSGSKDSYHFHILCKYNGTTNPKSTLLNTHWSIVDKIFNLKTLHKRFEESKKEQPYVIVNNDFLMINGKKAVKTFFYFMRYEMGVDTQIFGDISRMYRVPNTLNLKSFHYCIPVDGVDKNNYTKAKKQGSLKKREIFGKKLLKLCTGSQYIPNHQINMEKIEDVGGEIFIENLKPCVQQILLSPAPSHMERYVAVYNIIDALLEGCFDINEKTETEIGAEVFRFIDSLQINGKHIWNDYNQSTTKYHISWCIRSKKRSYSCKQLKRMGLCTK